MSILSENIRYLRNQINSSQQKVADALFITRGRYAKYEDGASEPPIELLLRISRYFHISIDLMVSVDLRRISIKEIMELPDNRILLPVKVDEAGENRIEIVPHRASMGYLTGYSNPEYIERLQNITLPFLGSGKYRAFPAEGDSMPPHKDGAYIIGRYIDSFGQLKTGKSYVFITREEGITYKRLKEISNDSFLLSADNDFYDPYALPISDVFEIWEYTCSIATDEFKKEDFAPDHQTIIQMLKELKGEIKELKSKNK
ncbi:XRE family transcriptional regulator [Paenimyroides ceti]